MKLLNIFYCSSVVQRNKWKSILKLLILIDNGKKIQKPNPDAVTNSL